MGEVPSRPAGYDDDFFLWTQEQAQALRALGRERTNVAVDWENVAEEIESLGRRDRDGCKSHILLIVIHLIKMRFAPHLESRRHWRVELDAFRTRLDRILDGNPTLRARMDEFVAGEHRRAFKKVLAELEDYPHVTLRLNALIDVPDSWFSAQDVLDDDYYPEFESSA